MRIPKNSTILFSLSVQNEREKEIFEFNNRKKDPPPLLPFVSQFTVRETLR